MQSYHDPARQSTQSYWGKTDFKKEINIDKMAPKEEVTSSQKKMQTLQKEDETEGKRKRWRTAVVSILLLVRF